MKNEINPFTGKPKYPQRVTYLFSYTGATSEPRAHEAAREFSGEIEQLSESCTQVVMRDEWQVTVVFANKTQRAMADAAYAVLCPWVTSPYFDGIRKALALTSR